MLTILHSERPKLYGVLAILSAIGLMFFCHFLFRKETQFVTSCFFPKDNKSLSKWGLLLKERIGCQRSNDFL